MTGRPGAGKSTVANLLAADVAKEGHAHTLLDGDDVRRTICRDLGYSVEDRDENIRRVIVLASERRGLDRVVLVALISPLRGQREAARRALEPGFVEVHVP